LAPQEGEEEELAGRRQTMMQAEKIASDIAEAHQVLAGSASPVPTISSAVRKLERKSETAPGLLDGAIEAFDGALDAWQTTDEEIHPYQMTKKNARYQSSNMSELSTHQPADCPEPKST